MPPLEKNFFGRRINKKWSIESWIDGLLDYWIIGLLDYWIDRLVV